MRSAQKSKNGKSPRGMTLFPVFVLVTYGIIFAILPDRAWLALRSSGTVFLKLLQPLACVFIVMLVMNLLVKPAQIARFLGKGAGVKGIILSVVAGIISMGPIFVWYPLLKEVKEKGAGNGPIAIFLYNRAVKPFLLPVMIAYFGWAYVGILTILTVSGSIAVGYCLTVLMRNHSKRRYPHGSEHI
jgi:uncharacterized membrane protein YraQ (UPF0718 family)